MLEDIRSQLYQTKAAQEAELSRVEARLANRIDETVRNTDKFVIIDFSNSNFSPNSPN